MSIAVAPLTKFIEALHLLIAFWISFQSIIKVLKTARNIELLYTLH